MESVELRTISSRQKCVVCMLGVKVLRKKYAERESSQMEIRKKVLRVINVERTNAL